MTKQLRVIFGKDKGKCFPLPDAGNFSIGRGNTTNTRLTDVRVSRTHCEVLVEGGQVTISDSQSAVGTFVNEQRLAGPQPLNDGDVIRIGDTQLKLEDEDVAMMETLAGIAPPVDLQMPERPQAPRTSGPLAELAGSRLGQFQLTDVLARGQSSIVFRSQDTTEPRAAAVKVLMPTATKTDGEMQRVVRNLQPLLPVRHANLVSLYAVGKERGYCYFAMELVDGENLTQLLQRVGLAGMLNWDHALRIGMHVTRGLAELHKKRIIHRNLSPRSILINNSDKQAKIGGMWLARSLDAGEPEAPARPNEMLRDLPYLPPEQMHGDPMRDPRSDLYSLGATLYHLLTGRPPFEGKTIAETITQVLQKPPPRPRDFQLSLPPAFENIVLKLLSEKPGDRPESADEVLDELERVARDPSGNISSPRRNGPAAPAPPEDADGVIPVICSNPSCGQRLSARKKCAGTQVRCPTCGTLLVVPGQMAAPAQVAVAAALVPAPRTLMENPNLDSAPIATRPQWQRAAAVAVGAGVLVAGLVWYSGLFGSKASAPVSTEKSTAPK